MVHEDGDWRKDISIDDCIDAAKEALQKDPTAQVIWYADHAYVVPTGALDDTEALEIPRKLTIAGQVFKVNIPFQKMTYGALLQKITDNEASNITNLIKRIK